MKKEEKKAERVKLFGEMYIKTEELKELKNQLKGLRMKELGNKLECKPEEVFFEEDTPGPEINKEFYNFGYDENNLFPSVESNNYFRKTVHRIRKLMIEIKELKTKIQNYN